MEIVRSAKYRLYPTAKQKSLLHNHFGSTRFVFNSVLGMIQESKFGTTLSKSGKEVSIIPSQTQIVNQVTILKSEYPFLYQTGNDFLQAELNNLYSAFKKFFAKGGSVKAELSLGTRIYECEHCNYIECRDINAAKNILASAKRIANL